MRLLAVDTATHSCSVAVVDAQTLRSEITIVTPETHSKHLMPLIVRALRQARCSESELDGLAVSLGPGTFTGLRIGLATIKGLASALDKPVVGVPTLKALAWQAGPGPALVCGVMDARRKQVYYGFFKIDGQGTIEPQGAPGVDRLADVLAGIAGPCRVIGNGLSAYAHQLPAALPETLRMAHGSQHILRAGTIAYLAQRQVAVSGWDDPASLVPIYLRKSDAEIKYGYDSDLPVVLESLPTLRE